MVWGKGKPKGRSGAGDEFKNILIPSNCSYLKTPYLHLEIYSKLHDTATNWDKGAQREKGRMSRPQFLWFKVWSISGRLKRKRKKSCQNYVIFHHCCISRLGCKMFCLPKHKGKRIWYMFNTEKTFPLLLQLPINRKSSFWWAHYYKNTSKS